MKLWISDCGLRNKVQIQDMSAKIILGVTGSIAAHKAADLASLLTKQKCSVRVVMTADAQRFITPLPFQVLSRHPVVTGLFEEEGGWKPTHIELADQADLLLIAPATANVIAKLAHGLADNALTCIALALNPQSAPDHASLGRILCARQQFTAAREAYRQALDLQPTLLAAREGLADLHFRLKEPEQAAAVYAEMQ